MYGTSTNPFYYSDGLKNNHIIPLGRLRFLSLSLSLSLSHLIFFEFPLPGRGEKRTCRAQSFQVDKRRNLQSVRRISALSTIPTGYSGTIGQYFKSVVLPSEMRRISSGRIVGFVLLQQHVFIGQGGQMKK